MLVPIQGFLNALVYGWTRSEFVSVMTSKRISPPAPMSLSLPYGTMERQIKDMDEEEENNAEGLHEGPSRDDGSMSPVSLGTFLGEDHQ